MVGIRPTVSMVDLKQVCKPNPLQTNCNQCVYTLSGALFILLMVCGKEISDHIQPPDLLFISPTTYAAVYSAVDMNIYNTVLSNYNTSNIGIVVKTDMLLLLVCQRMKVVPYAILSYGTTFYVTHQPTYHFLHWLSISRGKCERVLTRSLSFPDI